jgi:hypothetical protein
MNKKISLPETEVQIKIIVPPIEQQNGSKLHQNASMEEE